MWSKLDVIVVPCATAGADTQSKVPDSATPALVRRDSGRTRRKRGTLRFGWALANSGES